MASERLPNADRAIVDIVKLRDYCLNPRHPRGRHKAKVFASALGMSARDAESLCQSILDQVGARECRAGESDEFGSRFVVECHIDGPSGSATVCTAWIVRAGEDVPRLTTCYVM